MAKPHDYQNSRNENNEKVGWYLGLEEWRENEIVVTVYDEGTVMYNCGDNYTHERYPCSSLVEDSFQVKTIG